MTELNRTKTEQEEANEAKKLFAVYSEKALNSHRAALQRKKKIQNEKI
jgi:hypothetical protein